MLNSGCGSSSSSTLIRAVHDGNTATVKSYLDNGIDPNIADEDSNTALILAARDGSTDIVDLLIERGANVNAKSATNTTALMEAANQGWVDIVKSLLIAGAEVNVQDENGMSAWMMALNNEHKPSAHGNEIAALLSKRSFVADTIAALFAPSVVHILEVDGTNIDEKGNLYAFSPGSHRISLAYWKMGEVWKSEGSISGEAVTVDLNAEKGAIYVVRYDLGRVDQHWMPRIERYH